MGALGPVLGLAWRMRIERWDPADETTAAGCYQVHRAAHLADEADDPPFSAGTFGLYLLEGFDKTPGEVWFAVDDAAGVVGYYRMQLWTWRTSTAPSAARLSTRRRGAVATDAPCSAMRRRGRPRTGGRC